MHATSTHLPHDHLEPEQLASSVARQLSRSYRNHFSISPVRAGILGVLTLGLAPLLRMRAQFRSFISFERQQLWYFAEFLRTRGGGETASAISDATRTFRYDAALHWMQNFCILGIILVFWHYLPGGQPTFDRILNRTFRFIQLRSWSGIDAIVISFVAWNAGLALAYGLHWLQVNQHRCTVARALANLPPGPMPADEVDVKWPIIGLVLAFLGGAWGLVMAGAGAAHRRYINETSASARAAMLQQVRESNGMPISSRPVLSYTIHARRCENGLCRATLPQGAEFCPRCGSRVAMVA